MKWSVGLLWSGLLSIHVHASILHTPLPTIVHREEFQTVTDASDNTHPVQVIYLIEQRLDLQNNQETTVHVPMPPEQPKEEPPSYFKSAWDHVIHYINPLKITCIGGLIALLYYAKSKFTLYSLSKACVQNALWSLWRTPKIDSNELTDEATALLLHDILQTYRTQDSSKAITQFIQDMDKELNALKNYIKHIDSIKSSFFSCDIPDIDEDSIEAKKRIHKLETLKEIALNWLKA